MVQSDPPPCEGAELQMANAALEEAKSILDQAIGAVRRSNSHDQRQGQKWLGLRSSAEAERVREILVRSRAFAAGANFLCAVATPTAGGYYAFVRPDNSFAIVLGPDFLAAPTSGFSSKAGTLVHEISHFALTGATDDPQVYGRAKALRLATSDPKEAQHSAENIEYYVEAVAYGL